MDMLLFPYNSMFSMSPDNKRIVSTYAIKLNGERINYSNHMYWKKDFIEQSLTKFAAYMLRGHTNYLETFIDQYPENKLTRFSKKKLVPDKKISNGWPVWFCRYAGFPANRGAMIELIKYDFDKTNNIFFVKDSSVIYKMIAP